MSKRAWAVLVVALSALAAASVFLCCRGGKASKYSLSRVTAGMRLEEVERILGPGQEIAGDEVPQVVRDGRLVKVVEGDRYFKWPYNSWLDGPGEFFVSFRDGKVLEKHDSFKPLL